MPVVVTIEKLGLAQGQIEKLSHAIKLMKNVREMLRFETPTARNVAKQTAENPVRTDDGDLRRAGLPRGHSRSLEEPDRREQQGARVHGCLPAMRPWATVSGWETAKEDEQMSLASCCSGTGGQRRDRRAGDASSGGL